MITLGAADAKFTDDLALTVKLNTTSATTYTMYFLAQGGTAQVVGEGTTATIILYEVLA